MILAKCNMLLIDQLSQDTVALWVTGLLRFAPNATELKF